MYTFKNLGFDDTDLEEWVHGSFGLDTHDIVDWDPAERMEGCTHSKERWRMTNDAYYLGL